MDNRRRVDPLSGKSKSMRHNRVRKSRAKYSRKEKEQRGYFPSGYILSKATYEEIAPGHYEKVINSKSYVKRFYRGKMSTQLKKICNRKFRRNSLCEVHHGNQYRKHTEFWLELY